MWLACCDVTFTKILDHCVIPFSLTQPVKNECTQYVAIYYCETKKRSVKIKGKKIKISQSSEESTATKFSSGF